MTSTTAGWTTKAIEAIDYAANNGATLINASWGGTGANPVLDQTIIDSKLLFVAASGNAGVDLDAPGEDFYPAESNAANVLTVGAIDQTGQLPDFTNYGATRVDLMAPGTNILSRSPPRAAAARATPGATERRWPLPMSRASRPSR